MKKSGLWVLAGLLMGCWSSAYAGTSAKSPRVAAASSDLVPPGLRIITPGTGATIGASAFLSFTNPVVTGTASDNVGVTAVDIKLTRVRNGVKYYWNFGSWSTSVSYVQSVMAIYGEKNVTWSMSAIGPDAFDNGPYTLTVQSRDGAGNGSTVATRNFNVIAEPPADPIKPGVTITSPRLGMTVGADAFLSGTIVRGTAVDNAGVKGVLIKLSRARGGVKYYWNGGAWTTKSAYAFSSGGIYGAPNFTWNMLGIGPDAFDTGTYELYVQAQDTSDNIGPAATRSFKVVVEPKADTIAPGVTITSPPVGMTIGADGFLSGTIVRGTAVDNVGVKSILIKLSRTRGGVKYYWNGGDWTTNSAYAFSSGGIYGAPNFTWNMLGIGPDAFDTGTYDIYVQAEDTSDNIGPAATRSFKVVVEPNPDQLGPSVTITNPLLHQSVAADAFGFDTVRGTAADNVGVKSVGVKFSRTRGGVKYYWNGGAWSTTSSWAFSTGGIYGEKNFSWAMIPPAADAFDSGQYDIWVQGFDLAGNAGTPATRSFNVVASSSDVDTEKPKVTITNPPSGKELNGADFDSNTVYGTATDNKRVLSLTVKFYRVRGDVKEYWTPLGWITTSAPAPITGTGFGSGSATWNLVAPSLSDLDEGIYTVWAQAEDYSGNLSDPVTRSFTVGHILVPKLKVSGMTF